MEDAIGDLRARLGLILMGLIVAFAAVGYLIFRFEEAEDGEKEEVR